MLAEYALRTERGRSVECLLIPPPRVMMMMMMMINGDGQWVVMRMNARGRQSAGTFAMRMQVF